MDIKRKVLVVVSFFVFLIFGFMVAGDTKGILFDQTIMDYVHKNSNQIVIRIMEIISFLGSENFLFPSLGIVIGYFIISKRYCIAGLLATSSLGSWIVNYVLKQMFRRTRPLEYFLVDQGGLSYPSGHSMVTMTMFLTIAYLLTRKSKNKHNNRIIWIFAIFYILSMGVSRVFLGVHWPTDIIGGYAAGYIFYEISINLIETKYKRNF